MVDTIGIILSLIGALFIGGMCMASGNILVAIIAFIISFGYLNSKFQEGASRGSGYRQEKQNEEILQELRKQNNQMPTSGAESSRIQSNNDELNRIDKL